MVHDVIKFLGCEITMGMIKTHIVEVSVIASKMPKVRL